MTTGDSSQPVHVWLVLTPLSRGAVRVRGRAKSVLNRVCDRCADEFAAVTDGVFEVIVLPEGDVQGGRVEEEDAEAVDWFHGGLVDLRLHVRDAVYLGLPTRALCCADCPGLSVQTAREEGGGARGESFE